jgi:hypothetical protein
MAIGTKVRHRHRSTNQATWTITDTKPKPTETKLKTQEPTAQSHRETGTSLSCRSCRGLHFERKAVQTKAGPPTGQYTQHRGRERGGRKGAEGRLGGGGGKGRGRQPGATGKREIPEGKRDGADKGGQPDRGHTTRRSHAHVNWDIFCFWGFSKLTSVSMLGVGKPRLAVCLLFLTQKKNQKNHHRH